MSFEKKKINKKISIIHRLDLIDPDRARASYPKYVDFPCVGTHGKILLIIIIANNIVSDLAPRVL